MRVLMLSWEFPPLTGTVSRYVAPLSGALARAGHDVTVVTRHAPGAPQRELLDGVCVVRAEPDAAPPAPGDRPLAWTVTVNRGLTEAALGTVPDGGYDLVHAHDWLVTHAAVALKQRLGTPFVATLQGTEAGRHQGFLPAEANRSVHSVEWWLGAEARRVLVPSEYLRWEVTHLFDVPADRVDVVPNGIDPARWRVPARAVTAARLRFAGEGPLIVYAGRLVAEKGVQDLLAALPKLRERHPGTRAVIAGDGDWRAELIEEARRQKLHRAVSFPGRLDQPALAGLMAAADAFVLPNRYEPTGTVALEAAAAGAPLVVATTGGLASIVAHGVTGIRFPVGDPDGLVEAVDALLSDPQLAQLLAGRARRMVEARHSWAAIAARTAELYAEALTQAPAAAARSGAAPLDSGLPAVRVPPGNLLADPPPVPIDPTSSGPASSGPASSGAASSGPERAAADEAAWLAGVEAARAAMRAEGSRGDADREAADRDAAARAASAPFDVVLAATQRR